MNHAGVKSSIDSSRMFNEPYAEIPSGALGTWGCPGSPGGRVHLSPSPSICLTDSFVSLCLPLFGPGCLPAWTPVTALWGGGVHLSPFVSLHLSPVVSQPGCLARLSGWTGSFVTLCLPSFVSRCLPWHGSLGGRVHLSPFVSLHLSGMALWALFFLHLFPVVSQPGCLARLSRRTDSLVSLCLPSFVSCLPAWMPGTALWVDSFTCLPLSPFIWLPLSPSLDVCHGSPGGRIHLSPLVPLHLSPISVGGRIYLSPSVSLYLSPVVSQPGCLSGWTDSFVSLCLPLFVSHCLPAWMPLWVDGFICLPLSPSLDVWHSRSAVSLPAVLSFWRGLVCLRLRPWLRSFLVLWMLGTGSSVCPSSGLRFCLGSWWVVFLVYRWLHPVCSFSASLSVAASLCPCSHLESRADESGALRCTASATMFNEPTPRYPVVLLAPGVVPALPADGFLSLHLPDRFICLPLSPFIWPRLSPSLDACHSSLGGQIRLSPSLDVWHGFSDGRVHICLPLSPSCCPPAWMPGTAPWSFAVYSAGTHVCLRLRNVCLSARVRLIKPQAACCGCTYECFK